MLFLCFPLRLRKGTAAVILPIQIIFCRQLNRTLISILFLKIRGKPLYTILCGQPFPDLIQLLCILHGTDRQRGSKEIITFRLSAACCFTQSQLITGKATFSPFRALLHSLNSIQETLYFIIPVHIINCVPGTAAFSGLQTFLVSLAIVCFNETIVLIDQALLFFHTFTIFTFLCNIRIKIEHRNFEELPQIFQHIATAGCAAAVQKQPFSAQFFLGKKRL